jgi:ubiquinone/menaquinone biosynthesis C-methylase UbiE
VSETALDLVADGYNAVYAGLRTSATLRRLWRQHVLGSEYPDRFEHISFLTFAELERLRDALALRAGETVVDLACGAGGPGLWIARRCGARLAGIDLSPAGVEWASARAAELGLSALARFSVGSFERTGLATASADAAMSVDALQYAPSKRAALDEAARVLRPGGRLAFTAFELERDRAADIPVLGLDPVADYRPALESAGFEVCSYEETSRWRERVTATYEAVSAALDALRQEMGQRAAAALALEVSLTLQQRPYRRRVLATAIRR